MWNRDDSPITWLSFAWVNTFHEQQFLTLNLFQLLRNVDYFLKALNFLHCFSNFLITRIKRKMFARNVHRMWTFLCSSKCLRWCGEGGESGKKIYESFRDVRKAFKLLSNGVHLAQLRRLRLCFFANVFLDACQIAHVCLLVSLYVIVCVCICVYNFF